MSDEIMDVLAMANGLAPISLSLAVKLGLALTVEEAAELDAAGAQTPPISDGRIAWLWERDLIYGRRFRFPPGSWLT